MSHRPASASQRLTGTSSASFHDFFDAAKQQPVYVILGVQGSGTNLLRSILVRAFGFSIVQDQSLVYNAALKLGRRPSPEMVRRQFVAICERLFPSALSLRTRRRIKSNGSFEGIQSAFDASDIRSGVELAQFVFAYGAFSRGTTLMAIKSDDLWENIRHIDQVLPNRRIVLLTRDFRDNLLSVTNKNFGPIEPLVAAYYVKERFEHYDAEYKRALPERRLHVRYEDLLVDPDGFVSRFAIHFGLDAQGHTPTPVDTTRIRRNNTRKWGRLRASELAYCEAILRNELQTYGYATECDPVDAPPAHVQLLARGRDGLRRVPQKLRLVVNRFRK
jgi:hypothetical protein